MIVPTAYAAITQTTSLWEVPLRDIRPKQPDPVEVLETIGDALPLNEEPVRSLLRREARKAGAVVDFGDLPDDE